VSSAVVVRVCFVKIEKCKQLCLAKAQPQASRAQFYAYKKRAQKRHLIQVHIVQTASGQGVSWMGA